MTAMRAPRERDFVSGLTLHEEAGRGAYGSVWRATRGDEEYAVKLWEGARDPSEALLSFRREAAIHAGVRHPAVPRIYEVGLAEGRPYMVTEFVHGQTLAAILARGPLGTARTLEVGGALADALDAVHKQGLVHRDLKPRNILVQDDGRVRLIDFGLARHHLSEHEREYAGTLLYGAPEQIGVLERAVDGRADLYGLGCVLYECVSGRAPFNAPDASHVLHAHAALVPQRLDAVVPTCPKALADAVARLLEKDPDDRYQSAGALLTDLRRLARQLHDAPARGSRLPRMIEDTTSARELFVGRTAETARVVSVVRDSAHGRGRALLLEGPSGCGKSRIVEHALAHLDDAGALVLRAKCNEADPCPHAAIRDAVRSLFLETLGDAAARSRAVSQARVAQGAAASVVAWAAPEFAAEGAPRIDDREVFLNAVVGFFQGLVAADPLVVWVDDVQWIDDASLEVLHGLARALSAARVALVLTGRSEAVYAQRVARVREGLAPLGVAAVQVHAMDDNELRELLARKLGEAVPEWFVQQVIVRSHGSPMAARQIIRTMKETGALVPSWGSWTVDPEAVSRIPVSADLYEILSARVALLPGDVQEILAVAALLGERVDAEALAACCEEHSHAAVRDALSAALAAQLIEPRADGSGYAFVHDRIRETLARELARDPAVYHARAADHLERNRKSDEDVYQLAAHLLLTPLEDAPDRTFNACLDAAELSNAKHAPARAHDLLATIEPLLDTVDVARRLRFHRAFGYACFHTERVGEAVEHFRRALAATDVPLVRATLRAQLARALIFGCATSDAAVEITRAFAELGRTLPSASGQPVPALLAQLSGLMAESLRAIEAGAPPAAPDERDELAAVVTLCHLAFLIGYYDRNLPFAMQGGILGLLPAWRLGDTAEACVGMSAFGLLAALMGRPELVERFCRRALEVATRLGDRQCLANTMSTCGIAWHMGGNTEEALSIQRTVFESHGEWLGPLDYQTCCIDLASQYFFRGYFADERRVSLAAIRRLGARGGAFLAAYACRAAASAMSAEAVLGLVTESAEHMRMVEGFRGVVPADRAVPWVSVEGFRLNWLFQQDEFGRSFAETVAAHDAWQVPPARTPLHAKHFYVAHAWAAVERVMRGHRGDGDTLTALRESARNLDTVATIPTLRAHARLVQANLLLAEGDAKGAWQRLDEARAEALDIDSPWMVFEEARCRARVFASRGRHEMMHIEAVRARAAADELGWRPTVRRVEAEFALTGATTARTDGSPSASAVRAVGPDDRRLQRQLDALLALSRASASVVDLDTLARIALDEVARILGAERGMLFLCDEEGGAPRFFHGRTANGLELHAASEYSATVVADAVARRRPVLVATRNDAQALGAESVLAYDLRSVVASPLLAGERLLGVVYLDSRLARGVFNQEQVELLFAMGHVLAAAIETSRAARLEARLEAETERRRLAEALRELNTALTSTLDPTQGLEVLLSAIAREVPHDAAAVVLREGDGLEVAVARPPRGQHVPEALRAALRDVADGAVLEGASLEAAGAVCPTMILPLRAGGVTSGAVILQRGAGRPFADDELAMATTLASQAGIAIENARLFQRVKQLAERDGLTGVYNRREFFRRATLAFEECARGGGRVAALLFDVDHFKRFNDRYGHAVGDEVLRLVAGVAARSLGDGVVFGRYGGEEFVALLPGADVLGALDAGNRLRRAIENNRVQAAGFGELMVTVSVGVSSISPGDELSELLNRADRALLQSKSRGRNVVTAC